MKSFIPLMDAWPLKNHEIQPYNNNNNNNNTQSIKLRGFREVKQNEIVFWFYMFVPFLNKTLRWSWSEKVK